MSSDLMTSTMKSDPAGPLPRLGSCGVPTSAAATLAEGGSADGSRAGSIGLGAGAAKDVAGDAPCAVTAAPATAAPDRNLRRLTLGSPCRLAMKNLPAGRPAGVATPRAHRIRWTDPVPNPLVITLRAAATLGLVTQPCACCGHGWIHATRCGSISARIFYGGTVCIPDQAGNRL